MLAAAYGVAMRFWADPHGEKAEDGGHPIRPVPREADVRRERASCDEARPPTGLRTRCDCACQEGQPASHCDSAGDLLTPPFAQIPSPFVNPAAIDEAAVTDSRQAMHMDFANYTIGRLVPDRGNYQEAHRLSGSEVADRSPYVRPWLFGGVL